EPAILHLAPAAPVAARSNGEWCNGNTTGSGPVVPGSNPGSPARSGLSGVSWGYRLAWPRIPPSQGGDTGSNPVTPTEPGGVQRHASRPSGPGSQPQERQDRPVDTAARRD